MPHVTLKVKNQPLVVKSVSGASARKKSLFVASYAGGEVRTPSYWDGGSKDDWTLVAFDAHSTRVVWRSPSNHPMFERGAQQGLTEIPEGHILVRSGTFAGKPSTPTIMGRPHDLAVVLAPLVLAGDITADTVAKLWPDLLVFIDAEMERPGQAADLARGAPGAEAAE